MATFDGGDDDVEIHNETEIDIDLVSLANAVRDQLLKSARGKGNLYGPTWAQKKTPLASKPQAPGTQRVW
jgi:hypothetical protein